MLSEAFENISMVLNALGVQKNSKISPRQVSTSVGFAFTAPVFSLHEEDLLKIFSFLSLSDLLRVSRVCRWWYSLSFDPILWRDIDLRRFASRLTDPVKMEMLIMKRLSSIQCLDLSGFSISEETLRILFSFCKHLRVLKLKSVTFTGSTNRPTQMDDLEGRMLFPDSLEYLDIRFSQGHARVYRAIASRLCNIRFFGLCDAFLYTLLKDGTLETTIESFKNLQKLDVSHCQLLKDNTLALFACCSKLKELSVRKCCLLTGSFLEDFLHSCNHLKTLILDGTSIDDETLQSIRWDSSTLVHLELGWCPLATSRGLTSILPRLIKIKTLEYLGLCANGDSKVLNGKIIHQLEASLSKRSGTKLKWLSFHCSRTITKNSLDAFQNLNSFVEILEVTNCTEIANFPVERNVQKCDTNNNLVFSKVKATIMKYATETLV